MNPSGRQSHIIPHDRFWAIVKPKSMGLGVANSNVSGQVHYRQALLLRHLYQQAPPKAGIGPACEIDHIVRADSGWGAIFKLQDHSIVGFYCFSPFSNAPPL